MVIKHLVYLLRHSTLVRHILKKSFNASSLSADPPMPTMGNLSEVEICFLAGFETDFSFCSF
jgi:hypothetical protein